MRVAVNLNMFHPELPLLQRYKAAATAGFRLVEVSLPYSEKAEELKKTADSLGLSHTLINAPPGDWSKGFRGLASLPSHKKEFEDSIATAVQYAKTLSCDKVHIMAGIPSKNDGDVSRLFQENVAFAAKKLGEANLMCLIEPINHYTIPGYFLSSYEQAKAVIDAVKLPNLKIQYDLFHAQQICGQITATIQKYKELIGYIQVAQVPSRDEPSTPGELDYKYVFESLKSANPDWTIGLEHNFHEAHGAPKEWVQSLGLSM
ncbi:putative hydroxypyruvate isomerase [Oesophagostomum dentatum]|uniref:Putative hydroxypyruvate isomerase n=1 Tax=Oesophagostomum dentatum TaxID=61180 RepID=A0A0B1SZH2_OESDE|nr:putative hydroxypyruvate isomerase [Oesophagostomum dentatum]